MLAGREHVRGLTSEYGQHSSGNGDLGLRLVGGGTDLDALESQQGDDEGGESEEQRYDHESATRLHVTCEHTPRVSSKTHRRGAARRGRQRAQSGVTSAEARRRNLLIGPSRGRGQHASRLAVVSMNKPAQTTEKMMIFITQKQLKKTHK